MSATTDDPLASLIFEIASKVETARAKVNLALHVTGRRPDGYHLLDSLVVFAEVADTLRAVPLGNDDVTFTVDGQFVRDLAEAGDVHDNLVLRAADLLIRSFPAHRIHGVRLELTKRLPVAAGLGGGSADAAAALRRLNRTWGLGLAAAELAALGLRLGADVPMCLLSRPLRASGIGERVTPVAGIPALPLLLVNPGVRVATPDVFRRLARAERPGLPPLPPRFGSVMEFVMWLRKTRNDLTEPASALAPEIGRVLKALAADPDCLIARMTGSGATVFGVFMSVDSANRAADRLHAARPDWWLAVTTAAGA
jgi:4-diphosphocytidyl-2-C-methyl-D-erythritol kinase